MANITKINPAKATAKPVAPTYEIADGKLVVTVDIGPAAVATAQLSKAGKAYIVAHVSDILPPMQGKAARFSLLVMHKV